MPHVTSSHQTVTVSVGVACTRPNDSQRPGDLIEAADAALYAAKHRGRNAVVEHGFAPDDDGAGSRAGGLAPPRAPGMPGAARPRQPVDPTAAFVA